MIYSSISLIPAVSTSQTGSGSTDAFIIKALKSPDSRVRDCACSAIGNKVYPYIKTMLLSSDPADNRAAAVILESVLPLKRDIPEDIYKILLSKMDNPDAVRFIGKNLGRITVSDAPARQVKALPYLRKALESDDVESNDEACCAIDSYNIPVTDDMLPLILNCYTREALMSDQLLLKMNVRVAGYFDRALTENRADDPAVRKAYEAIAERDPGLLPQDLKDRYSKHCRQVKEK